jgi:hypothetical protein
MNNIPHNILDVPLRDNSRIQILESLEDLPRARKHQYAAFVRSDSSLLVWADSASRVIDDAMEIEKKIIELIWDDGDAVGRYEKVDEDDDDELELEKGYTPPKRGRVLLQPLLVCGVYHLSTVLTSGVDSNILVHRQRYKDSPSRDCNYWRLVSSLLSPHQSHSLLRHGKIHRDYSDLVLRHCRCELCSVHFWSFKPSLWQFHVLLWKGS